MVRRREAVGKRAQVRFANPPWSEEHPQWQQLDQQIRRNHLARAVVAALQRLDLTPLFDSYSASGSPPTRPDLMLRIVLIELRRGRTRPNHWFIDTQENEVLKWAGFGIQPSRTAWYDFHTRLGPLLEPWNRQIIEAAIEAGMTEANQAALDGSSYEANASRHRLINQQQLTERLEKLTASCAMDERWESPTDVPAWMANVPETRAAQRRRYERAQERLQQLHGVNNRQDSRRRRPADKIVVSPTDPDAALGRDKFKVFRPLYNVQLLDDLNSPFILAYDVFPQSTDAGTLKPMLGKLDAMAGIALRDLLVDAGYVTANHLAQCDERQITLYGPWQENDFGRNDKQSPANTAKQIGKEAFVWLPEEQQYVCPQGHRLRWIGQQKRRQADGEFNIVHSYRCSPEHCRGCPLQARCAKNPDRGRAVKRSQHEWLVEKHRARMATDAAKQLYKRRKQTVELGFADIKENRGLRRFPRRGLAHARTHVGLLVLTNNLIAYHHTINNHETAAETSLNPAPVTT